MNIQLVVYMVKLFYKLTKDYNKCILILYEKLNRRRDPYEQTDFSFFKWRDFRG